MNLIYNILRLTRFKGEVCAVTEKAALKPKKVRKYKIR